MQFELILEYTLANAEWWTMSTIAGCSLETEIWSAVSHGTATDNYHLRTAHGRRHDGAVDAGGFAGEVAPGAHGVVLRVVHSAGVLCPATSSTGFQWLFNSYYESFAKFPEKRLRSSFSRPGWRRFCATASMWTRALSAAGAQSRAEALKRIELGVNHEEQHQELLLTDILHAFFTNPLRPAYLECGGFLALPPLKSEDGAPHMVGSIGFRRI
jgi:hypothetical protein